MAASERQEKNSLYYQTLGKLVCDFCCKVSIHTQPALFAPSPHTVARFPSTRSRLYLHRRHTYSTAGSRVNKAAFSTSSAQSKTLSLTPAPPTPSRSSWLFQRPIIAVRLLLAQGIMRSFARTHVFSLLNTSPAATLTTHCGSKRLAQSLAQLPSPPSCVSSDFQRGVYQFSSHHCCCHALPLHTAPTSHPRPRCSSGAHAPPNYPSRLIRPSFSRSA